MNEEIYSGKSPFIWHEGMTLNVLPGPGMSEAYFRRCMTTGRINPAALGVMKAIYRYGYLNRHMLSILFPDRTERSMKECLAHLVKNGFIDRCCTSSPENLRGDSYFYRVSEGAGELFAKNTTDVQLSPAFGDAGQAVRTLVLNQFIIGCEEYRKTCGTETVSCPGFEVSVDGYVYRPRYYIAIKKPAEITFVPIPVRREPQWEASALDRVKTLLGTPAGVLPPNVVPVMLCEDLVHCRQLREVIGQQARLKDRTITYITDTAVAAGSIFDRLLVYSSTDSTGEIIFTEVSM